jgi:alternate signal-mediated exported protein
MNSKLMKASLAGVAAIALTTGGTTFAAWSDFGEVNGVEAAAGYLKLDVSSINGPTDANVTPLSLMPGERKTQEFFISSADSGNTPDGDLSVTLNSLSDTEDTVGVCTTRSEGVAEGVNAGADCGTVGELSQQLRVDINKAAVPAGGDCTKAAYTYGPSGEVSNYVLLKDMVDAAKAVTTLSPAEGVCLRVEMYLPDSADNKIQGDEVSFNWRFDLDQAA